METFLSTQSARISRIKPRLLLLVAILLVAAFLRLYKISEYMTFLGDEGRDVLIVKHILEGKLTLLGPTASVGGFFLGPIYYYFMAPFLWLWRLDPTGPAVMVALFGVATVFMIYWVGKEMFNEEAGLFASTLYAISPLVIGYSRSSWNPNLMPFFSILMLLILYKANARQSPILFVLTGVFLGIAMQLHYLAIFMAVIVAVFMLLKGYRNFTLLVKNYLIVFLGFLIGLSPFLAFEVRHGFPNIQTIVRFIFGATGETGFTGDKFFTVITDVFFRLFGRLVTKFPPPEQVAISESAILQFWQLGTLVLGIASLAYLIARLDKRSLLVLIWLTFGVILFGFYRKPIYDYYFGFMFPLPFLLVGNLLSSLLSKKHFAYLALLIFILLVVLNLSGHPFRYSPNRQLAQVRHISEFVLEKAEGKPFNFALITGQNSDHGYRYFFELLGNSPLTIENPVNDPQRKTVTDQLLIICEDPSCKPLGHPLWEVAGFGRTEIVGEWQVSVVKVYELVHYKGE